MYVLIVCCLCVCMYACMYVCTILICLCVCGLFPMVTEQVDTESGARPSSQSKSATVSS